LSVRVIVVVPCKVPEVAVTVTVEVLADGAGVDGGVAVVDDAVPPPQPERSPKPAQANATSIQRCQLRRFLHPQKQTVTASVVNGKNGLGPGFNAVCALAAIVSWVVAAVPDGVTVAGAKEHVAPVGNPEHAKLTGELNPF
jgi:hypothetical protein